MLGTWQQRFNFDSISIKWSTSVLAPCLGYVLHVCVFYQAVSVPRKNTETPSTQSLRRGEVKVNASQWISSRVAMFFVGFWCVSRRKWMGMDGNGTIIMHSYYGSFLYSLRLAPVSCWILYMDLGYFGISIGLAEKMCCAGHIEGFISKSGSWSNEIPRREGSNQLTKRPRLPGA